MKLKSLTIKATDFGFSVTAEGLPSKHLVPAEVLGCVASALLTDNTPMFMRSPEEKLNANLIAAAPELLSALKDMVKWHGETHQIFCSGDDTCFCQHAEFNHRVNTAIAKAEGRE